MGEAGAFLMSGVTGWGCKFVRTCLLPNSTARTDFIGAGINCHKLSQNGVRWSSCALQSKPFEAILQTRIGVNGDSHHGNVAIRSTVRHLVTKTIGASEIRNRNVFERAVRVERHGAE